MTGRLGKIAATAAHSLLGGAELGTLRALRRTFARGGLPPKEQRSPEEDVRIACFTVIADLLRVLEDFRVRVERGEAVRLAVREQMTAPGWMRVELAIEAREASCSTL
jgi:hypothetical protein